MVAFVDRGNLQPLRLEPRGSADDPVTHNNDWKSCTALDISPRIHIHVGNANACSLWFLTANLQAPCCYEVS